MTAEELLSGGAITAVVRVGDTVRRPMGPHSPFVHDLLRHFEAAGWTGAPRYLGVDEKGREILSYLEGPVDWDRKVATRHEAGSLQTVARLMRAFHDLTAGTPLAGGGEVVCHNDPAPRNTVYRSATEPRLPYAFIDWDNASPGRRVEDVAHLCWQFVELGPKHPDVQGAARDVAMIADTYALGDRAQLIDTILWWQDRCWRGIEDKAAAGEAAMAALRDRGAVREVRTSFEWVRENRPVFEAALR